MGTPSFLYKTFRKPLNTYAYLPFCSNHPLATRAGIISTELVRLLLTNRFPEDFHSEIAFFSQRLCDRGYPIELILKHRQQYLWSLKSEILGRTSVKKPQIVPLKLKWSQNLVGSSLHSMATQCVSLLDPGIGDKIKVVTCFISDPNLFRARYGRFL